MEMAMFDQVFEGFRKASESSLQMQQELFRHFTQQFLSTQPNAAGMSADWSRNMQKRCLELGMEMLNRHRESIDGMYKSGIQMIEQTFRLSEIKSPDDYRRLVEDLWRKLFDTLKDQSESQFRDFQKWSERSAGIMQDGRS